MEFAEYRMKALAALWPKFYAQFSMDKRNLIRQPRFSTWHIDNICATNWKSENPLDVCVNVLFDYINTIME